MSGIDFKNGHFLNKSLIHNLGNMVFKISIWILLSKIYIFWYLRMFIPNSIMGVQQSIEYLFQNETLLV